MTSVSFLRTTLRATAFLCALLLGLPAWAQFHGGGCACGRFTSVHPTWEIDHSTTAFQNAAIDEFSKWHNVVDRWGWTIGDNFAGINGKNEILFFTAAQALSVYGVAIDSGTFGFAFLSPQSSFGNPPFNACPPPAGTTCGLFTETDVIMNADFSRGWTTALPNYNDTGPANYAATALHELGHALGLHHNFNNLSTMNYYEDFAGRYLSIADAAIARLHYPSEVGTVTDMGTYPFRYTGSGDGYTSTVVASPNPSSVFPGQPVTLRDFTVENPGSLTLSNVVLSIYLSTNTTITTSDILVGTLTWNTFSTNGWWDTAGWSFTVPPSTPPGTYYIGAIVTYNTSASDAVSYNNSWVLDDPRRLTVGTSAHTLSVFKAGTGSGKVGSSPAGIDCGLDCSESYAHGTVVSLGASPAPGSVFAGWSGACAGTGSCVVTMDAAKSVTATFNTGAATCSPDFVLDCGSLDSWSNAGPGNTNSVGSYACLPFSYSGPEYTYIFQPSSHIHAQIDLSGLADDLDLIVLRDLGAGCQSGNCVTSSTFGGLSNEQVRMGVVGGHTYYIVVDGFNGAISDYDIQLTCDGVTFVDVPTSYWAFSFIQALYNAGVTTGCASGPRQYCPDSVVSRDQMAVFLERTIRGRYFTPSPAIGIFSDVPASYWAAGWIELLYQDGITSGCASAPLRYCPGSNVTRAEMAVFLLRAKHGSGYTPPPATGLFSDVPVGYWAAPWIEQLYNEGITSGCGTSPLRYCPENPVTRSEMAVFLTRTFNLSIP